MFFGSLRGKREFSVQIHVLRCLAMDSLGFRGVLFIKLRAHPVDTYRRLVLDPENCEKNDEQGVREEGPRLNSDLNKTDTRPDKSPDKSMEITTERTRDVVSDPNYPSYEILLEVAGKLLDSFEKE
jgi:hypothetical protein